MAVTDFFVGEFATELRKRLFMLSANACRYKGTADKLITMIQDMHPTIEEIQFGGVELPAHRQAQIRMLSEALVKGMKLTDNCIICNRWNIAKQLQLAKKMEKLEKTIAAFVRGPILTNILADIHLLRANSDVRWDRVDRSLETVIEQVGSMKIGGGGLIREAMKRAEAMEIETNDDLEKFGVGLELGKRKVKRMMFESQGGIFGISGMGGVGKTTLARELERDDEVRCHFENRILFLTVSQSPILEELREHIWGFLSGCEAVNPVPDCNFQFEGTRKLVILDDVWTTQALDRLTSFKIPGCTTLVVSRSKLTEPKCTYDVEVLSEDEAISLFCLCAFGQKSVPSGFCSNLVKQVANECKCLPLALKVTGTSLNGKPEKYWEGILQRLSRGEPADESHESRLLNQMKVKPTKIQVFINFRGVQLRNNFVGYLVDALRRSEINVFIDNHEQIGEDLNTLFKRIEDSGIAIVVFSSRYTESKWCLEELVKIKERVHQGLLKVLPIFYKVTPTNVKRLKGEFGDHFRDKEYQHQSDEAMIKRWKEAIMFVSHNLP